MMYVSMTDLEAIQQYEKMLSIQEALMGAEGDVNVEETTGVSCLSACMHTNIATYVCNHIMDCGHKYVHTYIHSYTDDTLLSTHTS